MVRVQEGWVGGLVGKEAPAASAGGFPTHDTPGPPPVLLLSYRFPQHRDSSLWVADLARVDRAPVFHPAATEVRWSGAEQSPQGSGIQASAKGDLIRLIGLTPHGFRTGFPLSQSPRLPLCFVELRRISCAITEYIADYRKVSR